ncbi:hypothetical protein E4T50_10066 [Aureobasidium sp. EXF-12298]|nr:hypothetical protein E4T50_10066 [Aureobasidium sp. EXF-12298]KAI4757303.1 hypothetical protein E4T51_09635 [Aureobasidium sp. EXF-12344]KAI4782703.1 hypothetical protein E4T52_02403 [Aureobasidium sp. EXF-3400]
MSFLSGFYSRLSGTFSRPTENEGDHVAGENVAQSDSANSNDASSRTLSPEDDQGDVNTPEKAPVSSRLRIPPTPSFAPPATPFAGQASPVVNQAAADQLMREAGASAPTPALKPTPFFGVFAPLQTPAARNLSPVRNQAAEEQLRREMLGDVPETPATVQPNLRATPMTQYKTPSVSHTTPTEPLTELSVAPDALQTPSLMPSKRQHQNQSPIQEESEILVGNIEQESPSSSAAAVEQSEEEREDSEGSAASSPHAAVEMDLSEAEDNDTSTTSIESSDSEKRRVMAISTTKGRRNQRRPNQRITSKSYEDRRSRVQKATRPGMGRSVSGREELLNRARKRFYDGKAGNNKLF